MNDFFNAFENFVLIASLTISSTYDLKFKIHYLLITLTITDKIT